MTITEFPWQTNPDHFWLRGQTPKNLVEFDERLGHWDVYGHPEIVGVLNNPGRFSSDISRLFPIDYNPEFEEGKIVRMDPPEHGKLRRLLSKAFTPKMVADLEPRIAAITAELLDTVDGSSWELVTDLAYPLPVIVVAELLGVPPSDRKLFRRWAGELLERTTEMSLREEERPRMQKVYDTAMEMLQPMLEYVQSHAADRRQNPRDDLLTRLVEAEVEGQQLTNVEVVNFALLLLLAGHVTTTMLLGNTMLCLDTFPEHDAAVRADRTLVPTLIEESLRYLAPFAATARATTTEVELGGHKIGSDQLVKVWLGAGNRDERVFDRPHVFDPARDPNPHLGLGRGVHFCLGAGLARLEGQIAVNMMLDRFPTLRTDSDNPPIFLQLPHLTGIRVLPLLTR